MPRRSIATASCLRCRFSDSQDFGLRCLRFPPSVIEGLDESSGDKLIISAFPGVQDDWKCYEFDPSDVEPETETQPPEW